MSSESIPQAGESLGDVTPRPRQEPESNADLFFQEYCVVLVDMLGQKNLLRQMTTIPETDAERERFLGVVRSTVGTVITLRNAMESFFTQALDRSEPPKGIKPEMREQFEELRDSKVLRHGFSDLIVLAVPLGEADGQPKVPMNGVWAALFAACSISLVSLAMGRPLRGGVDIGIATALGNGGEVYGAALERAYSLEASFAEYPRIVVGPTVFSYLDYMENQRRSDLMTGWGAEFAQEIRRLLVQDTDGRWMLDFMGPKVREVSEDAITQDVIRAAIDHANAAYEAAVKRGDEKLSARYFRLLRYMKFRLPVWA